MAPIYRNDRVKVVIDSQWAPIGTKGKFLGERRGSPGVFTVLVRLDDGQEIRVPLLVLDLDKEFVMDGQAWKTDIPTSDYRRHVKTVDTARLADGTQYEIRGSSERWFVVRIAPDGETKRTRFFPNGRDAKRVFDELAGA